jgi:hypothetical protein
MHGLIAFSPILASHKETIRKKRATASSTAEPTTQENCTVPANRRETEREEVGAHLPNGDENGPRRRGVGRHLSPFYEPIIYTKITRKLMKERTRPRK